MKKILLFVFAALFAYTMNAQVLLSEDFESGLGNWTLYDSDGDGYNWQIYTYEGTAHGGTQSAMSASYYGGALTPDNWMVSAPVTVPATGFNLKYYVAAQDPEYAEENYSVYIATGNTVEALSATTPVHTEVLASGEWEERVISLDAYVGQTIYVGFRHHDVTDMFYMKIDDVEISKPSSDPEIGLLALNIPNPVATGVAFNISGTVKNYSQVALTSFDVTYSINGGANAATYTVTGLNLAYNETTTFTHNVPAVTDVNGANTITVTVSNPNGVADITTDNTLTANVTACASVSTFPLTEGFEGDLGCWQAISMNEANTNPFGITDTATTFGYNYTAPAHTGTHSFVFNSYSSASDYTQYLISPMLILPAAAQLSFYHSKVTSSGTETLQVMVSSTTTDIASFSPVGDAITATTEYTEATADLPANTKYVAIKYTSNYAYYLAIDDITISVVTDDPEIKLMAITTSASVTAGEPFNVTGTVKNNSAAALTAFDVTYSIDGNAAATITIDGLNVASDETYNFTHTTPATLAAGVHSITVTVSNPNGTADNTADNTLTQSISACGAITEFPFTETFDNGLNCWQTIDSDGDGYGWKTMGDWLIGLGSSSSPASLSYGETGNSMVSESYDNATRTALSPDNWMISPAIVVPATGTYGATWYAKSQDASYLETYSVYVGTSNDVASLSATTPLYTGEAEGGAFAQNAVMLDAYAGQTVYVAFRHHNVTDKFILVIDQFEVTEISTTPEITLTDISAPAMAATSTAFVVNATVKNVSALPLTSFDVACTVNGQTVNQQITGQNIPYLQSYSFAIDVPGIPTTGDFDITVTVSNPNGTADNTADNTKVATINIYDASTSVPRTVLLENFTGAWCQYCPSGHKAIEEALEGLSSAEKSRVVWVAHHNNDDLTVENPSTTIENGFPIDGFPSAMIDRTFWQGADGFESSPVYHPGYTTAAFLRTTMNEPAFVTVNISNVNYNASTRALTATVSGTVSSDLGTTDARLNVWLMEDGLVADGGTGVGHGPTQTDAYNLYNPFIHNNVVRANLSGNDAWGEAGKVTPTAGSNYTKNISTTVSNNYDASKCYLVAFVSNGDHSNTNNCRVYNAGKSGYFTAGGGQGIDDVNAMNVNIYPNPTSSTLFVDVEGLEKVEVIDMVGRIVLSGNDNVINLSNISNGVYSVRITANGNTAIKRVVKQ